jgi:hypothetical protein
VLSWYTDAEVDEQLIIAVEFNRAGEVMKAKAYDKNEYKSGLSTQLSQDLIGNQELFVDPKHRFDEKDAASVVATLKFADNMICSRDG